MYLSFNTNVIELTNITPIIYDVENDKWLDITLTIKNQSQVDELSALTDELTLSHNNQTTKVIVESWVIDNNEIKIKPKYCEII